jgi:hypothetical protein
MNNKIVSLCKTLITIAAFPFTLFLFLPSCVFLLNQDVLSIHKQDLILAGFMLSFCVVIPLCLLSILPKIGKGASLFFGVSGLTFFLLTLFPYHTGEVSGFNTFLASGTSILDLIKFLVFVLISVFVALKMPKKFVGLCALVILFSFGTSGYLLLFTPKTKKYLDEQKQIRLVEDIKLGSEKNIIVLVLDAFTGYSAFEIFQEHPELKTSFNGFTLYPYAIGNALNTPAGLSIIMTGDIKNSIYDDSASERLRKSFVDSFIMDAQKKGFDPFIISRNISLSLNSVGSKVFPVASEKDLLNIKTNSNSDWQQRLEIFEFYEIALARITPAFIYYDLKNITNKIAPLLLGSLPKLPTMAENRTWTSKIGFNNFINSLAIGKQRKKILFYHLKISHPPSILLKDGSYSKGKRVPFATLYYCVKLLSEMLKEIEQLNLYDDSLIIITADHGAGANQPKDRTYGGILPENKLYAGFNPLLMVKPPKSDFPFAVSNMTVWLGDIAPTVRDYLGLKLTGGGYSLLKQNDIQRKLNTTLFIRPDQVSHHSKLADWKGINFSGNFNQLSSLVETSDPYNLLKKNCNIELYSGRDHHEMKTQKFSSNKYYEKFIALISIDKIKVAKRKKPGFLVCINTESKSIIKQYNLKDIKQCITLVKESPVGNALFLLGVKIPKKNIYELVSALGISLKPSNNDVGNSINFTYWNGVPHGEKYKFQFSTGDVPMNIDWNFSKE